MIPNNLTGDSSLTAVGLDLLDLPANHTTLYEVSAGEVENVSMSHKWFDLVDQ